jgi:formylglycine-generating enzyme required for sulfatase activity
MKENMKRLTILTLVTVLVVPAIADTFGSGTNAFNIDFVTISGDASSANGAFIGTYKPEGFTDPTKSYRMGTKEITNDQWDKFKATYGAVAGTPTYAYDYTNPYFPGSSVPTNFVSWYQAAQFVNFLNTSTGHTAAYNFTGEIHTSDYTLDVWDTEDADGANLYRNKNAKYFLPTENEWVKAAYWNGTNLQTYATKAGESLYQGNGSNGGWNYGNRTGEPWAVGSGSQELNGTYDMMGNLWEWMESPYLTGDYLSGSNRGNRGGACIRNFDDDLALSIRNAAGPWNQGFGQGFRVASVPEPCISLLLGLGFVILRKTRK